MKTVNNKTHNIYASYGVPKSGGVTLKQTLKELLKTIRQERKHPGSTNLLKDPYHI